MKLLAVESARAVWLFNQQELNPRGKAVAELLPALVARYGFARAPRNILDIPNPKEDNSLRFEAGTFKKSPKESLTVISFSSYPDGVVADTRSSTVDSHAFVEDVMEWVGKEFGLVLPPESSLRKLNLSTVTVLFDKPISLINPILNTISGELTRILTDAHGQPTNFGADYLAISPEQFGKPGAPARFTLERKVNTTLAENKYFSQAPIPTEDHLRLLEQIEAAI